VTVTGAAACQGAQPPLQSIELTGAAPSGVTVNDVGADASPAAFVAVAFNGSDGSAAPIVKV
jgi:hypothetical protein